MRQQIFMAMVFTFSTMMLINYFLGSRQTADEQYVSGQKVAAPKFVDPELNRPLVTEIDFLDAKMDCKQLITDIETPHARYSFTSQGAGLRQVEFKRLANNKIQRMNTLSVPSMADHEKITFLLALDAKTPLCYELVSQENTAETHQLMYRTAFDQGTITKKFTVYDNLYQVDCTIDIQLNSQTGSVRPRLFFASPFLPELGVHDVVSGIVNDGTRRLQVIQKRDDSFNSYWARPSLFGSQDRYFVHALVKDPQSFVQRGYFKAVDLERMYTTNDLKTTPMLGADNHYFTTRGSRAGTQSPRHRIVEIEHTSRLPLDVHLLSRYRRY